MRDQDITLPPNGVMGVYAITNTTTGAQYIGSSNSIRERLVHHFWQLRRARHPIKKLQQDWATFGPHAFAAVVLEATNDPHSLSRIERRWFDALAPIYNTTKPLSRRRGRPSVSVGQPRNVAEIADLATIERRFWARVQRSDPASCWPWSGSCDAFGYGSFSLSHRTRMTAHRAAYLLTHGELPMGLLVRHVVCDTAGCVNPAHLALGTQADNMADKVRRGRVARGDRSGPRLHPERLRRGELVGNAKLTVELVHTIRRRAAEGASQRTIAREVSMSPPVVGKVIRREAWAHVPPGLGEAAQRLRYMSPRGAAHWCALLDGQQRAEVVTRFKAGGVTQAQLAAEFGVSGSTIGKALQEAHARPGRGQPGRSGVKGVHYNPQRGCKNHYVARIYVDGRYRSVGRFATAEQATAALEAYRRGNVTLADDSQDQPKAGMHDRDDVKQQM